MNCFMKNLYLASAWRYSESDPVRGVKPEWESSSNYIVIASDKY